MTFCEDAASLILQRHCDSDANAANQDPLLLGIAQSDRPVSPPPPGTEGGAGASEPTTRAPGHLASAKKKNNGRELKKRPLAKLARKARQQSRSAVRKAVRFHHSNGEQMSAHETLDLAKVSLKQGGWKGQSSPRTTAETIRKLRERGPEELYRDFQLVPFKDGDT